MRTNKVKKNNLSKCSSEFSFSFSIRLREARKYKKLKQEDVAEKLGIESRTYQHYEAFSESNARVPNLEIVSKLAKIFDCDIDYLVANQKELRKDTSIASETIGLKYDTVDIISNSIIFLQFVMNTSAYRAIVHNFSIFQNMGCAWPIVTVIQTTVRNAVSNVPYLFAVCPYVSLDDLIFFLCRHPNQLHLLSKISRMLSAS